MKLNSLLTASMLALGMVSPLAMGADAPQNMSDSQKKEFEKVIHEYLVKNPEILLEASQALQQKQQQAMQEQAQVAIKENSKQLFADKLTTLGNPKGDVTLVEFFDYQCIHCKKMSPLLINLMKEKPNLHVIYKELPIFGKNSETATKVAFAAALQGKYKAFNEALLTQNQRLTDQVTMDTAKSIGLNMDRLKKDMDSKEVTEALEANRTLAEKLHLMGTPAFIIASTPKGEFKEGSTPTFIPGAVNEESLKELIDKAAKS